MLPKAVRIDKWNGKHPLFAMAEVDGTKSPQETDPASGIKWDGLPCRIAVLVARRCFAKR